MARPFQRPRSADAFSLLRRGMGGDLVDIHRPFAGHHRPSDVFCMVRVYIPQFAVIVLTCSIQPGHLHRPAIGNRLRLHARHHHHAAWDMSRLGMGRYRDEGGARGAACIRYAGAVAGVAAGCCFSGKCDGGACGCDTAGAYF